MRYTKLSSDNSSFLFSVPDFSLFVMAGYCTIQTQKRKIFPEEMCLILIQRSDFNSLTTKKQITKFSSANFKKCEVQAISY